MEKNKLSVTQQLAYTDAVTYLEALVESFKAGNIVVEQGGEFVTLSPREHVEVTIEAKAKKDKQKFSLELSWVYPPAVETAAVTISAEAPAVMDAPCCGAEGCPCGSTESSPESGEESASSEVSATPEIPASQEPRMEPCVQEPSTLDTNERTTTTDNMPPAAGSDYKPVQKTAAAAAGSVTKTTTGKPAAKRPAARKKTGAKKAAGNKTGTKR